MLVFAILPHNLIIMVLQCQIVWLIHSCVPEDDQNVYEVLLKYHIALNFRRSKFSRIAIFEHFVEIIPQIHCTCILHVHTARCVSKILLKYFRNFMKFAKLKTRENLVLYSTMNTCKDVIDSIL